MRRPRGETDVVGWPEERARTPAGRRLAERRARRRRRRRRGRDGNDVLVLVRRGFDPCLRHLGLFFGRLHLLHLAHERVVLVRRLGGCRRRRLRRRRHRVGVFFAHQRTLRDRRLATQTVHLRGFARGFARGGSERAFRRFAPRGIAQRGVARVGDEGFRELDERLERRRLGRLRRGVHLGRVRRRAVLRDLRLGLLHETGNRRADLRVARDGRHVRRRLRVEPRAKRRVLGAIDPATIRAAFPRRGLPRRRRRLLGETPGVLKLHGDGVVDVVGDVGVASPGFGRGGRAGGGGCSFGLPRAARRLASSGGVDDAGADRLAARDRGGGLRGDRGGEANAVRRGDERRAVRGGARFDLGALGGLSLAILGVEGFGESASLARGAGGLGAASAVGFELFGAARGFGGVARGRLGLEDRRGGRGEAHSRARALGELAELGADRVHARGRLRGVATRGGGGGDDRRGGGGRAESGVGSRLVRGGRALERVQGGALRRAPLERPGGGARSVQDVTRAVQERREVVAAGRDVVERGGDRRGDGHGRNVRHRESRVASADGARATSVGGHRAEGASRGAPDNDANGRIRDEKLQRTEK